MPVPTLALAYQSAAPLPIRFERLAQSAQLLSTFASADTSVRVIQADSVSRIVSVSPSSSPVRMRFAAVDSQETQGYCGLVNDWE